MTTITPLPTCLVCGEARARLRWVLVGHPVYRCAGCGFEFVAPTPSAQQLAEYYDRSYAVPLERYARYAERNHGRIADLERWCPQRGRLLEVGASYGHSLAFARARGWQVAGVELSPTAARHARARFRLDVACADVLDAPLAPGSFDAAILWHVLEHTRDPRAQLGRLAELLRPGGVLGLRVPNAAGFGARLAGRAWPWMCPPAHLWYFSPATLSRLLRDCGFTVLEVQTLRGDGNNPYQHALIALGGQLNALRRRLISGRSDEGRRTNDQAGLRPSSFVLRPDSEGILPSSSTDTPAGLVARWQRLLAGAQPITDALARATALLIEPLERRGWGDELLMYARLGESE